MELVRNKCPNLQSSQQLKGCTTIHQEVKHINRRDQLSLVVTHNDFHDDEGNLHEVHAVKCYLTVEEERDLDLFFDAAALGQEPEGQQVPLPPVIDADMNGVNHRGANELIAALTGVVEIDDDNEPAPETIPVPESATTSPILHSSWGHSGFSFCKQEGLPNNPAKLSSPVNTTRNNINLQLFEHLFPRQYVEDVIIIKMNKKLKLPCSYGEFLRWIGIWVLISTVNGCDRHAFWLTKVISIYEGTPFWLGKFMTRSQFEEILLNICYTNEEPPVLLDRFWEVCSLIAAWNSNMATQFTPSCINAIDESMSKWLNEYTCPRFMCVPRKPWKFSSEYHDAGCIMSDVIWQVDFLEGKDHPQHMDKKEYDELGATVGMLLCLMKPIHCCGKVFVLDSGFCVLKALVELKKKGVLAHVLIKKCCYWPRHVPRDDIIAHFTNEEVGKVDAIKGVLDDVPFYLFAMKEPDYVMQIMSTYGTLGNLGEEMTQHFTINGVH